MRKKIGDLLNISATLWRALCNCWQSGRDVYWRLVEQFR